MNFGGNSTSGLVIENGNLTQLGFVVDSSFKLGGLTFTTKELTAQYDDAASKFTLTGNVGFNFKSNDITVNFGGNSTSGLVIENGNLSSLGFVVDSSFKLGGLTFTTKELTAQYDDAASKFTLTGVAAFNFKSNDITVNLGGNSTTGLVIENGTLSELGFVVDSQLKLGGLEFKTTELTAQYTDADSKFTLTGIASLAFKNNDITVNFGGNSTTGLVIVDGNLDALGFVVDSKFKLGGLEFTTTQLTSQYTDVDSKYTLTGEVHLKFRENADLKVNFGGNNTSGLVIVNGSLSHLGFVVDSKFIIGGGTLQTKTLTAQYTDTTSTFTLTGGVSFSYKDSVNVDVNLGASGTDGLVIENGLLKKLGLSVNSKINVKGLLFTTEDLVFNYTDVNGGTYRMAGKASIDIKGNTVKVSLNGSDGLLIVDGTLTKLDATVNSDFTISKVKFGTRNLHLQYLNTNGSTTFALTGTAYFKFTSSNVTIQAEAAFGGNVGGKDVPGLLIENGSLKEITIGLTGSFEASSVKIRCDSLTVRYVAAENLFEMYGGIGITVGKGSRPVIDNLKIEMGDYIPATPTRTKQVKKLNGFTTVTVPGTPARFLNPGIRIVDGTLEMMDIAIKPGSALNFGSVQVGVHNNLGLRVTYDRSQDRLAFRGGIKVSLARRFTGEVAFTGTNGLTINTKTGEVNLDGLEVAVGDITYKAVTLKEIRIKWTKQGNTFDLSGRGVVLVGVPDKPAMKGVGTFEIVSGNLRRINVSLDSGGQTVGPFTGAKTEGSFTISKLDDPNELFDVSGNVKFTGANIKLGGKTVSLMEASGSFQFNPDFLTITGSTSTMGGLFTGNGTVRVNFNPGGFEVIPEKYDDPLSIFNGAKGTNSQQLFQFTPTRAEQLEEGIQALQRIIGDIKPELYPAKQTFRSSIPGRNEMITSYPLVIDGPRFGTVLDTLLYYPSILNGKNAGAVYPNGPYLTEPFRYPTTVIYKNNDSKYFKVLHW
ncbi:hypothetical protein BH11PLA2_BH11PLA2_17340 [soil metagenome]